MRYRYISYKISRKASSDAAMQNLWETFGSWAVPVASVWRPPTDVYETGDQLMVVIEIAGVSEEASDVVFDRVLLLGGGDDVQVGRPTVEGAQVKAVRMADVRGPKIVVFKMKKRKGYRRKNGHRQDLLRLRIQDITTA